MNDANFKPGTNAEVIKDSVSPDGFRVTTMEVTLHRFVLAELNTHRVFSRNSASSRAIPYSKQVARVINYPAIPVEWRAEQRGMQGGDLLDEFDAQCSEEEWLYARDTAVEAAEALYNLGVHKSIVNRILEPFMWHTVIITATEWGGFWHQRVSPLAQPEIRVAAEAMLEAYNNSIPAELSLGDWHLPYITMDDYDAVGVNPGWPGFEEGMDYLKKISAARCARVSYLTHDGKRDLEKDLELYDRLTSADPMHASPLEHVCTPAAYSEIRAGEVRGNLNGWYQLRHMVEHNKSRPEES